MGLGYCFIKGLKVQISLRELLLVKLGEQIVKPFLIRKNVHPSEDRKSAVGLEISIADCLTYDKDFESTFYQRDVKNFVDPKSCFSQPMIDIYCDYFIEQTANLTRQRSICCIAGR